MWDERLIRVLKQVFKRKESVDLKTANFLEHFTMTYGHILANNSLFALSSTIAGKLVANVVVNSTLLHHALTRGLIVSIKQRPDKDIYHCHAKWE